MSVQADLNTLFPGHRSAERAAEWEALKQHLAIGQAVSGTVIGRSPFGAWVDLGVGFPALLEITVMAGLTPERYRAGDWCPVGSEVTANVASFRDNNRQVGLGQVPLGTRRSTSGARGTPGVPPPTSDALLPLGDEVLERLEEWGYRDGGDLFGDLTLRDEVLRRLEEEICLDMNDDARPTSREPGTGRPPAPSRSASDREHPLWDRDLDG